MPTIKKPFISSGFSIILVLFFLSCTGVGPAAGSSVENFLAGADALNLKISKHYIVNADGSYKLKLYVKRRILTYKGKKEYADFKFNYNRSYQQVKLLKARTSTGKGEVITVKPEEIHDIPAPWNSEVSLYSKARQLVVSLPAVEPGSEIEIEIELQSKNGFWCSENFRLNDPIAEKTVIIDTPKTFKLNCRPPRNLQIARGQQEISPEITRYQWQGKNIPALTPERGAAPLLEQGFCLLASSFANWNQVAALFNKSFIAAQNSQNGKINDIQLDNPRPDDIPVSHQLYRQIRKLTTYEISFQETDWQIQAPAETRHLGYGTDCDLALLLATQLRQRQQPARIIMVCSQDHFLKKFADFPYPGWWDTALVKSQTDFFLFSSAKNAPGITGYDGRVGLDLENGKIITVKDRTKNRVVTKFIYDYRNFPRCQGECTLNLYGDSATDWRAGWRDLSQPEIRIAASQFLHQIDAEADFVGKLAISGLKDDRNDLILKCKFSLKNGGATLTANNTGTPQYLLPIPAPDLPFPLNSLRRERILPLIIAENLIVNDQATFRIPDAAEFVTYPRTAAGKIPGFSWRITCNVDPENKRRLIYKRVLTFNRKIIPAQTPDYQKLLTTTRLLNRPAALRIIFSAVRPSIKR